MIRGTEAHTILLATALIAAAGAMPAHAGDEIRIWPTATVTGDHVRLADVAELRGFDPVLRDRLSRLIVVPAPRPGAEILIRADDLRRAVANAGANMASTGVRGAARCRVSKPRPPRAQRSVVARPVARPKKSPDRRSVDKPVRRPDESRRSPASDENTLEYRLRQYILARAPEYDGRIEVGFAAEDRATLALREPGFRFSIQPLARSDALGGVGKSQYSVDIFKDDALAETVTVDVDVTLHRDVVVARRAINIGETIGARHIRIESRRFEDASKAGITGIAAVLGQQSKRFIAKGHMLPPDSIGQRPIVRRGEHVTIWHRGRSLVIKTTGKAATDGALGDRIRVRRDGNRRSRDVIDAVVTGPGTVKLVDGALLARK